MAFGRSYRVGFCGAFPGLLGDAADKIGEPASFTQDSVDHGDDILVEIDGVADRKQARVWGAYWVATEPASGEGRQADRARESWRIFQRQWARPGIIHAREVVPYAKSPVELACVKAARAAQRDDAADLRNLRPAHRPRKVETVYNGDRVVNTSGRPVGNSRAYALRRLRDQRP